VIEASCRVYRIILLAYPARLRQEFGLDMLAVFEEQLQDASREGLRKMIRVWTRAVWETVRVAAPAHLAPGSYGIAVLSLLSSSVLFLLLFWAGGFGRHCVK